MPGLIQFLFQKANSLRVLMLTGIFASFLIAQAPQTAQANRAGPGTLILGVSADYPPFEFVRNGEIVGFDIALARRIAEQTGYKLEVHEMEFDGLIGALQAGHIHLAMSGLTITPQRQKQVDFSIPFYTPSLTFLCPHHLPLNALSDLSGKRIGTQTGSTMAAFLEHQKAQLPQTEVMVLARVSDLVQELRVGRIAAVLLEEPQAKAFARAYAGLKTWTVPLEDPSAQPPGYAAAFPKGSPLKALFDAAILRFQQDGTLEDLKKVWIDTVPDLPTGASKGLGWVLFIMKGAGVTLLYSLLSLFFGMIGGALIALARLNPRGVLRYGAQAYVSIFRGTPLFVQLMVVYYALPQLLGLPVSALVAGVVAFSLNSSAYVSEVIRGGLLAVDSGQYEAAQVLNVPYWLMMRDLIAPQALRAILPALVNEAISLLKESAIISMIGEADLMNRAKWVSAETYQYFAPLVVAGATYYLMVLVLGASAGYLEKRLKG